MDGPRSRPVTKHDIEVKAIANGGTIDWEVDGKKPHKSELKFDRDSGAHEIKFDLDRDRVLKDRGLRFNCTNPIFVHDDVSRCPTSGVDEQIEVLDCSRDSLTIYDKNFGSPKLLRYQLNFVEDDGASSVCDPIIDNGGGRR
jgi:hypothetical protein